MTVSKVTIKDIAYEAGVSPALVSFVMRNLTSGERTYRVNPDTAAHVLEVADRLHYQPNLAARTLKSGRSRTIGVIISDISSRFFSEIVKYIEQEAYLRDYSVLFGSTDEDATKLARLTDVFINRGVDGLLIVPCENSDHVISNLTRDSFPVVLIDRDVQGFNGPAVLLDNYQAFKDLTEALINKGYRRIEMISYSMNLSILPDREAGYRETMEAAGYGDMIRFHRIQRNGGDAIEIYRKAHERGVEALVFATNTLALKGMADMYGAGINRNFGIACFGDNDAFSIFDNEVIFARQPARQFAQAAVERILSLVEGRNTDTGIDRIVLPSEIIQKA